MPKHKSDTPAPGESNLRHPAAASGHSLPSGGSWSADILTLGGQPAMPGELTGRGYHVRVAADESALLKSARQAPPDLVVLHADAVHIVTAIKDIKAGDDVGFLPVVVLAPTDAVRAEAYAAGADDVCGTDITVDELETHIVALLRIRRLVQTLIDESRELQTAYETQRDAAGFYQALFAAAPIPYFVVAPDTLLITHVSEPAIALTGYPTDSLVGRHIDALCPGETSSAEPAAKWLSQVCGSLSASGTIVTRAGTIIAAGGERVPVEAVARRILMRNRMVIELAIVDSRSQNAHWAERIKVERVAMLRETAIAVNSKVNDPLFVILNDLVTIQASLEGERLARTLSHNADGVSHDASVQSRLARALEAAHRIQRVTAQLSAINEPITREYLPGVRMLDLDESVGAAAQQPEEDPQ